MKTFISVALLAFSFSANAQCDNYSTAITPSCGETFCAFITVQLTGSLQVDNGLYESSGGTFRRKPNLTELITFINAAEEGC